tara:strand:- start:133 stop:546 length:414 start_codon:yes stop_codon:yes gene_type:complete
MNKFLRLVEENRPGEDKYTVELKDVNGELIDSFEMFGTGSPFDNFDTFKREFGSPIPVEDAEVKSGEGKYDINKEVRRLAGTAKAGLMGGLAKMAGTAAQEAKTAVKERDKAAGKAVKMFQQHTDNIITALDDPEDE